MKINTLLLLTFLSANLVQAQIPAYTPTNGLKGFWPFTGNAQDISGNGNHGTVNGPVSTTDRFNAPGNAYSFNGSTDYIVTNMTGILGNNPRAVSFWAKITESVSTMAAVQWGDEQSFPNHGVRFECGFNVGASGPCIIGADCAVNYTPSVNPYNNTWHHYVYQYASGDISQVQIYQDGNLLTQTNYTHNPDAAINTSSNWSVTFGRLPYMIPHYFNGALDEIGIWDRVLTNCEIHELYASAKTTVSVSPSSATICLGQGLSLTASGNINNFIWSTGQNGSQVVVYPTSIRQYTVNGTSTLTGCEASRVVTIVVNPCTGVDELEGSGVQIYPNPTVGDLTIETHGPAEITITNAQGQKISQMRTEPGFNRLRLAYPAEGIYVIEGKTTNTTWQKKVVVAR